MIDNIRVLLREHGRLTTRIEDIADGDDLFRKGLTSFACVQLLLAIEDHFDIEFPDSSLNRRTFASIEAITTNLKAITALQPSV